MHVVSRTNTALYPLTCISLFSPPPSSWWPVLYSLLVSSSILGSTWGWHHAGFVCLNMADFTKPSVLHVYGYLCIDTHILKTFFIHSSVNTHWGYKQTYHAMCLFSGFFLLAHYLGPGTSCLFLPPQHLLNRISSISKWLNLQPLLLLEVNSLHDSCNDGMNNKSVRSRSGILSPIITLN